MQVTISEPLAEAPSSSGTIILVVAEGLEVLLPMAGATQSASRSSLVCLSVPLPAQTSTGALEGTTLHEDVSGLVQ